MGQQQRQKQNQIQNPLTELETQKLGAFAKALVNQQTARVIVPPRAARPGFWFGGGNLIEDPEGNLLLVGRYRNQGDSRTGLHAGERGLELAIFHSKNGGASFDKRLSFSKTDLDVADHRVLSIEGSALNWTSDGVELFVSTEKSGIGYPTGLESYLKPGTGVWTIERLRADSISELKQASPRTVLASDQPEFLHLKDPFVYKPNDSDQLHLFFCTHPYSWASSNTAVVNRVVGETKFSAPDFHFFPRGFAWDVAISRGTAVLDVPAVGSFADQTISLMFYDGGESLRDLDQHATAARRPRGYSCEEIGGVAYLRDHRWDSIRRLSDTEPWFISPAGTGSSRYVDVHASREGYLVTWQQSQADGSQPLVLNFLSHADATAILD